jgi:ATP synthase protein I
MSDISNKNQKANQWMKYSGLAFQFLLLIGIGVLVGQWLDSKMENQTPYFTLLLAIIMLCAAMYRMIKDVMSHK